MRVQLAVKHQMLADLLNRAGAAAAEAALPLDDLVIVLESEVPGYAIVNRTIAVDAVKASWALGERDG